MTGKRPADPGAERPVLVAELRELERVPHRAEEALRIERLLLEVEGAELHGAHRHLDGGVAGEDDDGEAHGRPSEALEAGKPVHAGEEHVEEEEVGRALGDRLESFLGRGQTLYVKTFILQETGERAADVRLVVDDEDRAPAHAGFPPRPL